MKKLLFPSNDAKMIFIDCQTFPLFGWFQCSGAPMFYGSEIISRESDLCLCFVVHLYFIDLTLQEFRRWPGNSEVLMSPGVTLLERFWIVILLLSHYRTSPFCYAIINHSCSLLKEQRTAGSYFYFGYQLPYLEGQKCV